MKKTVPAISIIIPMYNVEKYIGECLDSIFAQTFQDYEVIAVDDCSTDKTCEIVEGYQKKFGDKLQLIRSKKNSGGAGIPRNIGIRLSIGEYLFFMDADDALVPTAFEELYPIAQKFNADIVHCEKYYLAPDETVSTDRNILKETSFENTENWGTQKNFVEEPTLYTNSLAERTKDFAEHKLCWYPWSHIIRRDLIVQNDIKYSTLRITDDLLFFFYVICCAKNVVLVPNAVYSWRTLEKSNSRGLNSADDMIHRNGFDFLKGVELADEFMNKFEFFHEHPECKYLIFDRMIYSNLGHFPAMYAQFPAPALDALVRREADKVENKTPVMAYMFARMNVLWRQVLQLQSFMRQQPKEIQDFQRQNEIIQRQQLQIQELQWQLRNAHDVFR